MIKTKSVKMIDVSDWDSLVQKTYGRIYSFQQQDGCKERGIFSFSVPDETEDFEKHTVPEEVNGEEMGVNFKAWRDRDPKQPIKGQKYDFELVLWWERNFYPDIQMVANDLHKRGLLEEGDYTINIDW